MEIYSVKRHPNVLPSISFIMLGILTLGRTVPLLLDFEIFVDNHNRQNVLLSSGGWIEENEVVVRAMATVAFLLQFSLLQVKWSSRSAEDGNKLYN